MNEDYLHYLWKFQKFDSTHLVTTNGENVMVKSIGFHNKNSGPDFLEGSISIGNTNWYGNIEIHIKSSDWNLHKHQYDKAYNNVILHVVFENDKEIKNENGEIIPTVELKNLINKKKLKEYTYFINNGLKIACQRQINDVNSFTKNNWLDRLIIERLETKTNTILTTLKNNKGDWNQTYLHFLMRYFGMKVNGEAMSTLSAKTSFKIIQKEHHNLFSLEALLYGQAGFLGLDNITDDYFLELRKEYLFLKQKYLLTSMELINWKLSKLRPPNFPTIRIAQVAQILFGNHQLFAMVRDFATIEDYKKVLKVSTSTYWKAHYVFGKEVEKTKNTVGKMLMHNIIINVISPMSFAYGKSINDDRYCNYATKLVADLPSENNSIVTLWKSLGMESNSAMQSQGIIELYTNYCVPKKCLNCGIGVQILK